MKKGLALLLAIVILCSLAACGSSSSAGSDSDSGSGSSTKDSSQGELKGTGSPVPISNERIGVFKDYIEEYIDAEHYGEPECSDNYYVLMLNDEYRTNTEQKFSNNMTIDGDTNVYMDMKVSELLGQGWSLNGIEPDDELEANTVTPELYLVKDEKVVTIRCANYGESEITYQDAQVLEMNLYLYTIASGYTVPTGGSVEFDFQEKINNASGLGDIISALGEPDKIEYREEGPIDNKTKLIKIDYQGDVFLHLSLSSDGKTIGFLSLNK